MKNYFVRLYQKEDFALWNDCIGQAKNATFLFHRNFMEYHNDRFDDYSLMVFEGEKLVAVLPANRVGETVFSHQGLTYGGLVLTPKSKLSSVIAIFKTVLLFLYENGILHLNLKPIPSFYCAQFADEIDYCLFITKANLYKREALSLLNLTQDFSFSKDRKQCVRRGIKANLLVKEEPNFELFWNEILIPNLDKKHQSKPVHTVEEITKLHQHFPENIRHFNVYFENQIVAGTTIFVTDKVAHPQYISGNEMKNELGSLDFLYHHLIHEVFADKTYFDFGPSHEENGTKIKEGILFWKESFGTKTVTQSFYEVETKNHFLLDTVLI
ncbi:MAG: GNAT family N-acetyltransferase [Flavobacterium sp.]|nr:GNAT family N-acetyltransferase [Flavobacterium sp.]